MKKIAISLLGLLLLSQTITAQQNFTNAFPGPLTNGQTSVAFWSRAGNTGGLGGINNVFGPQWNSPIYTITFNTTRMRLNGNTTANTTSGTVNTDGFLGLGNFSGLGGNVLGTSGPWSQLHIEGPNNTGFAPAGYRTWMRTGVFMNENSDNLYVGMKPDPSGVNRSDAVLNWGDDTNSPGGPDNMLFVYTSAPPPFSGGLSSTPNGREVVRMTPSGNVGIGPVFTNTAAPQSMLHLNIDGTLSTWLQITNQNGTQQTATDGTRLGILGSANLADNGNAYLYNQENRHLIFSTNAPTPTSTTNTLERVRITNIAAPTTLPLGGVSTYIPPGSTVNSNFTRMSISEDPNNPVTRPLSLLHIGYNTGNILNATSTDGWRPWMDVGMFASQGTDNVYIGLKQEPSFPIDRYDAVINWGDNNAAVPPFIAGPDNMRFIFTSKTTGAGIAPAPANGANGVEGLRMTPIVSTFTGNSAIFTGIGGDPTTNLYVGGSTNATNTLEVNSTGSSATAGGSSGLRFTDLNSATPVLANPGPGVLSVNASGDVIYVLGQSGGGGLGGACPSVNNMPSDWEVPMAGFNYIFTGQSATGSDRVGIGLAAGNCSPSAKLDVQMSSTTINSIATATRNNDVGSIALFAREGATGSATFPSIAGWFQTVPDQYAIVVPKGGGFVSINRTASPVFAPFTPNNINCVVDVGGTVNASAFTTVSDQSLKHNVNTLTSALSKVSRLRGINYEWNDVLDSAMNGVHAGFIAQEVDTVIPEVVHTDANSGLKSVAYQEIIPYLVEALKDEHRRNDTLASQLAALQTQVNGCCNANARTVNTNDVELRDMQSVVLDQNVPNPFAEQTTIGYFLPDNVVKAQMLFYSSEGKLINAVDLEGRGKGQINVYANDLSNGMYTYTLVADGKIMDTKRMVKSK